MLHLFYLLTASDIYISYTYLYCFRTSNHVCHVCKLFDDCVFLRLLYTFFSFYVEFVPGQTHLMCVYVLWVHNILFTFGQVIPFQRKSTKLMILPDDTVRYNKI